MSIVNHELLGKNCHYDNAKITALHYSLSGRVAERLDMLLWE